MILRRTTVSDEATRTGRNRGDGVLPSCCDSRSGISQAAVSFLPASRGKGTCRAEPDQASCCFSPVLRASESRPAGLSLWNASSHASRGGATVAPPRRRDRLDPRDPTVYFVSYLRTEL